ncbi:cupredoxin domain-containing protein [Halomonas cerina]|uniref:Putative cupredoxin-like copper-binding protein n=1 Tax=Halomonas cerina TaxID=447424 RepID=A0A839VCD6_9GAMM|nr:plastocyanin/azurin family copper-binding protein [Halomonas cerina]MBB3191059.1 putative cupredoxin-like copper-binding protein [Halomonas cerina]
MRKTLLALATGLAATTALAAGQHGGHHEAPKDGNVDRTISFEAGDMWFMPGQLDIQPGEIVKFEITNTGNLQHEFVIGDAAAQAAHREMMRDMAASGHGHGSGHHGGGHGDAMPSVTIDPGETATLVWTAPADEEEVEFACNIPGHYEAGMNGDIEISG